MAHSKPISLWPCYRKVCVWGLAAHCLKASIQGRLVEKKVCFISYASNWQEQWQPSVQRPTFTPMTSRRWEFYRQSGRGVTCRNSTVIFKLVMSGLTSVILVTFNSVQSLSHVQLFVPSGLQDTRLPCPSPTPGTCSNSCPSSWWCHPKHPLVVLGRVDL